MDVFLKNHPTFKISPDKKLNDLDKAAYELLSSAAEISSFLTWLLEVKKCKCSQDFYKKRPLSEHKKRLSKAILSFEMLLYQNKPV